MLDSIHEYAHHQLVKHHEEEARQEALARWVCHFAEASAEASRTIQHVQAFNSVMQESDNINTALAYLARHPDNVELYARTVAALGWIWNPLGVCDKPFEHAQRAIARGSHLSKATRAALLVSGGHSAYALGHVELSQVWFSEAARLFAELGDVLQSEYLNFFMTGQLANSKEEIPRLYNIRRRALQLNDSYLLTIVNLNLGASLSDIGELDQSLAILEEGLRTCEANQYCLYIGGYYINLSDTQAQLGNTDIALSLLEKAEQAGEVSGYTMIQAYSIFEACQICYSKGDFTRLEALLARAELLVQKLFSPTLLARFYFWRAVVAEQHKDIVQFYQSYGQVFAYLRAHHSNLHGYVISALLYSAHLFARYGDLERAGALVGYADAYASASQRQYRSYQLLWHDAVLSYCPQVIKTNDLPELETLLALAHGVLDVLA